MQPATPEIIVTANRREERAQDVPISLTAISAASLEERAVTQLQDLQASVPSLVIAPNGQRFSQNSIGMALATRDLMDHLRSTGQATSGPKAFCPRDRSNFLNALDNAVVRWKRAGGVTRAL